MISNLNALLNIQFAITTLDIHIKTGKELSAESMIDLKDQLEEARSHFAGLLNTFRNLAMMEK